MLQQTTVATVVPYFERWMERFPTVEALAQADLDEALALWAGLGYYSRCKRLWLAARSVVESGWPPTIAGWLALPGVGRYTAAAVTSIAMGQANAVVDGNVERVYSRLCGDDSAEAVLKKKAWAWAESVIPSNAPGEWNEALMELGATVCRPGAPQCSECPLQTFCAARLAGNSAELPRRAAPSAPVLLQHHIWLPKWEDRLGILRSGPGEWWEGLWGFPRSPDPKALSRLLGFCELTTIGAFRHSVTRHRIHVQVALAQVHRPVGSLQWVTDDQLHRFPMPAPQRRALALLRTRIRLADGQPPLFDTESQEVVDQ